MPRQDESEGIARRLKELVDAITGQSASISGADGTSILAGTGAPDGALGGEGDLYIDTASNPPQLYGPKTGTSWGSPVNLGAAAQPTEQRLLTIEAPGSSENITMFRAVEAVTITRLSAVLGSSGSVTWTIRHGLDRSGTGTEVVTSGTATTSTTTGDSITSFNAASIPANSWVWLATTAQSGSPTELAVAIDLRIT